MRCKIKHIFSFLVWLPLFDIITDYYFILTNIASGDAERSLLALLALIFIWNFSRQILFWHFIENEKREFTIGPILASLCPCSEYDNTRRFISLEDWCPITRLCAHWSRIRKGTRVRKKHFRMKLQADIESAKDRNGIITKSRDYHDCIYEVTFDNGTTCDDDLSHFDVLIEEPSCRVCCRRCFYYNMDVQKSGSAILLFIFTLLVSPLVHFQLLLYYCLSETFAKKHHEPYLKLCILEIFQAIPLLSIQCVAYTLYPRDDQSLPFYVSAASSLSAILCTFYYRHAYILSNQKDIERFDFPKKRFRSLNRESIIMLKEEKKAKLIQQETALRQEHRDKVIESLQEDKSADNVALLLRRFPDMRSKHGLQIFLDEDIPTSLLGSALLPVAGAHGDLTMIDDLILVGVSVDSTDRFGKTALIRAAESLKLKTAEKLLELGADVTLKCDKGESAVHDAVKREDVEMIKLLAAPRANGEKIADRMDGSILHEACLNGSSEILDLLLKFGFGANYDDEKGRTPLHAACFNGMRDSVISLVDAKANVDAFDEDGRTGLHIAARWGHSDIVETLLLHGANYHKRDVNGRTPYDKAMEGEYFEVAERLSEMQESGQYI